MYLHCHRAEGLKSNALANVNVFNLELNVAIKSDSFLPNLLF